MQKEISFSTLEDEYIALSSGMRKLVTGHGLLFELCTLMKFKHVGFSSVSNAWEDNNGNQNLRNIKGHLMTAM